MSKFTTEEIMREAVFARPGGKHDGCNAVDALFAIADALNTCATHLKYLGNGNAATEMGAIEAHGMKMVEAAEIVGRRLSEVCEAIADLQLASVEEDKVAPKRHRTPAKKRGGAA